MSVRLKIAKLSAIMAKLKDEKKQIKAVESIVLLIQLKKIIKKKQN